MVFPPHFFINCGRSECLGTTTCLKTVAGCKQGHATSKIISLQQSLFLCQLNFMEVMKGRGAPNVFSGFSIPAFPRFLPVKYFCFNKSSFCANLICRKSWHCRNIEVSGHPQLVGILPHLKQWRLSIMRLSQSSGESGHPLFWGYYRI